MGLQQTLKALSDPIRREILNLLKKGRMPAGEITAHFSVSAPAISRHLSVLKETDLIRDTREENSFSMRSIPLCWRKRCSGLRI